MPLNGPETYFISVGEQSGDVLGADLVCELRQCLPHFKPRGIVGQAMIDACVEPMARMESINTMGFSDVFLRLPELRMFESKLLSQIDRHPPAFAILIDFPGFHLRLAEQLRMRDIPVIQYVAPKVWAWGGSRVAKLKKDFSLILGVLPFEKSFFEQQQVPYAYCGSPHRDRTDLVSVTREDLSLEKDRRLFAFLPGSRLEELRLIMPRLLQIWRSISRQDAEALAIMPLAINLSIHDLQSILNLSGWTYPLETTSYGWKSNSWRFYRGQSLDVMKVADAAVVASGTATLECALLGTPMSVVYQMSPLSYAIAKRVVTLPYVSLVNLVAQRKVVEEYIQEFSEADIATELIELSLPGSKRSAMVANFKQIHQQLTGGCASRAAQEIRKLIQEGS